MTHLGEQKVEKNTEIFIQEIVYTQVTFEMLSTAFHCVTQYLKRAMLTQQVKSTYLASLKPKDPHIPLSDLSIL